MFGGFMAFVKYNDLDFNGGGDQIEDKDELLMYYREEDILKQLQQHRQAKTHLHPAQAITPTSLSNDIDDYEVDVDNDERRNMCCFFYHPDDVKLARAIVAHYFELFHKSLQTRQSVNNKY